MKTGSAMDDDWGPIPFSRLSHAGFCLRRAALLTNEQIWKESADTAKGRARKRETIQHPFLKEKISIGLIPYTQSMLFARVLRGDLDRYPPFMWR